MVEILGKFDIFYLLILDSLITAMYSEADPGQNQVRQVHLLDLYLNMPDKGSGDTPLHLAAKMNNYEVFLQIKKNDSNVHMSNSNSKKIKIL